MRTVSRGCGPWRLENPLTDSLTGLLVGGSGPCPTGPSTGRPRVLTTRRPASRRAIGPRERVPKRAGHRLGPDFRSHITVASSTGLWSLPSLPWPALPPPPPRDSVAAGLLRAPPYPGGPLDTSVSSRTKWGESCPPPGSSGGGLARGKLSAAVSCAVEREEP